MEDPSPRDLQSAALTRLSAELGPPTRRGDGCQWTITDTSGVPAMRLTLFLDGASEIADGWLCPIPATAAERVRISALGELELLLKRCRPGPPGVARAAQSSLDSE